MSNQADMERKISDFAEERSLEYVHSDDSKIVFKDSSINKKICIPLSKDLEFPFSESYFNSNQIKLICDANPRLEVFHDIGFKYGSYLELIINYSVLSNEFNCEDNCLHGENFDMYSFNIGNVKVSVDYPSPLFRLLFIDFENDDYYDGWNLYSVIKLEGIDEDSYEQVLQEAFFMIHQICPSPYDYDFPKVGALCYDDWYGEKEYEEDGENRHFFSNEIINSYSFNESNYKEPIAFYNASHLSNDNSIKFLWMYKILEYFFFISQEVVIQREISDYNNNKDIRAFIKTMHNEYFGEKEDKLLHNLLTTITNIDTYIEDAYNNGLIVSKNINDFSDCLYKHRNGIVHGKNDYKSLTINVPSLIGNTIDYYWLTIVEKIAYDLILKYCYNK